VRRRRLLWVFRWLLVGGEETEVRLLARHLQPDWSVDVVVCHYRDRTPGQSHEQLRALDDVPRLLPGLDALVWLSEGEGMPHVLADAGAAALPVVVTRDNGSEQQVVDGRSGLFVPSATPRPRAATHRRGPLQRRRRRPSVARAPRRGAHGARGAPWRGAFEARLLLVDR
jgi:glycosyltransferase involved in cell wall biosynthesis